MGDDERYMRLAIAEAQKAFDAGEVPVGAVMVCNGKVIARGHNQVELLKDSTAHAEMICMTAAFSELGSKYLPGCTLYVTVEPCLMCCGALYWSKLERVVYGTQDEKNGYRAHMGHNHSHMLHPKTQFTHGVLADDCAQLMKDFFATLRGKR